ncbi:MAG: S8 family serine peptidase, partial [Planctomycetota bacterium JB042]
MRVRRGTWALGLLLGCSAEALEGPVTIELHSRTVELDQGLDDPLTEALKQGDHDHVLAILLFRRDVAPEDHRTLRGAGIELLEFLGQDAYSAAVPAGGATPWGVLQALVRAGTMVEPGDKVSPAMAEVAREAAAAAAEKGEGEGESREPARLRVAFRRGVPPEEAADVLRRFGLEGEPVGNGRSYHVEAEGAPVLDLAADPRVVWIQPQEETRPLGELVRAWTNVDRAHRIDLTASAPGSRYRGPSGDGVRIAICDDGIDDDHPEFAKTGSNGTRVDPANPDLEGDHGTHAASVAAGGGAAKADEGIPAFALRGQAPEALLLDLSWVSDDLTSWASILKTHGCAVSNHSYAISPKTTYSEDLVVGIEEVVRGSALFAGEALPSRPAVFAAGNLGDGDPGQFQVHAGYYSIEAVAKNPIAVGAFDTLDGRVSRLSSLGPTIDGRLKPDLVAPGAYDSVSQKIGVLGALKDGKVGEYLGTSVAAPVVAGVLALVADVRIELGEQLDAMSAATAKALLVAAARDAVAASAP